MRSADTYLDPNLNIYDFKNFELTTLAIESDHLKGNPLRDPTRRFIPVLVPKNVEKGQRMPVVLTLSGFTGNGPKQFAWKAFELSAPQQLDTAVSRKKAPKALYVYVDAFTFWGGSQFLNSEGTGLYEDYIVKEICSALKQHFSLSKQAKDWCLMGSSSGGYGALWLGSRHPDQFGRLAAIAPDSLFEISLLPEIYHALPLIQKFGGIKGVRKEMRAGRLQGRRDFHTLINVIGMGTCYAPGSKKDEVLWPIDPFTGELDTRTWNIWKRHDPLAFLPKRQKNLKKLDGILLDVGRFDNFQLQYGTRQIHQILQKMKINPQYSEFDGNHFDCASRRPVVWEWLKKAWL